MGDLTLSFYQAEGPLCVIFGAGAPDFPSLPRALFKGAYIIAADGGVDNARALHVLPDLIIGDFDSLRGPLVRDLSTEVIELPHQKELSDLHAAVLAGIEEGCCRFLLLGCTGGRLDHLLANLFLLQYIRETGGEGILADSQNVVHYLDGFSGRVEMPGGFTYVSLLPVDRSIGQVTLTGFEYPLKNARLSRADTRGISNEPNGEMMIEEKGACFLVFSKA